MKESKIGLIAPMALAGLLVLGSAGPASAVTGSVTINPSGGTSGSTDLNIEVDRGSFIVTRNGQNQNYSAIDDDTFNGVILSITAETVTSYVTPRYDNALGKGGDFTSMVQLGSDELSNGGLTVTSEFYADIAGLGSYDSEDDAKLKIRMDYVPNTSYFLVTYTVTPASNYPYEYDLYHGIDMFLDGIDTGPGSTGTAIDSNFPGRYVIQTNTATGAIGGFVEADYPYTSYFADEYDQIVDKTAFTTIGYRGPYYAEPLPDVVNPDEDTDIGLGIHFDLGTLATGIGEPPTPVVRNTNILFSAGLTSPAPAPYTGPLLTTFSSRTLDPCSVTSITITGSRLSDAVPTIQGKEVTVLEQSSSSMVLEFPAGLTPGNNVDLVINSSSGTLTHQDAFDIPADTCAAVLSKGRWTQLQSDGTTVKIYAKDPIGDGKIQFFVDGEEIAWVNAIDEADPKLSFASSYPYLVRSVELKPGKNRFEIKLDGVRVWRATYVPKG